MQHLYPKEGTNAVILLRNTSLLKVSNGPLENCQSGVDTVLRTVDGWLPGVARVALQDERI